MFQLERQVLLTYTTWRWIWFFVPMTLLLMLLGFFGSLSRDTDKAMLFSAVFGIGIPICAGMQLFVAVSKWQFANSRARLIPGYTGPHLRVIGTVLGIMLVANPLVFSLLQGISPLGPLAFALLLGGLFLHALQFNSALYMLPIGVVLLSGMYPPASPFWFSDGGGFGATHAVAALAGLGMVVAWLWRLANLNEEMDDYQVMPLGIPGSLSRLELVEQRRMQGRKVERGIWGRKSTDFWHDRLAQRLMTPTDLAEYGWGQIPGIFRALLIGLGCVVYGVILSQVTNFSDKSFQTISMLVLAAVMAPAFNAGILLRQRKSRLAQELLRPASREEYFDGLLKSLAKQAAWMWLSLSCAALVVAMLIGLPIKYNLSKLVIGYLLWVPSAQLLLVALAISVARWRSSIACISGGYVLAGVTTGIFMAWADAPQYLHYFYSVSALMGILFGLVGWLLLGIARRAWLREELG